MYFPYPFGAVNEQSFIPYVLEFSMGAFLFKTSALFSFKQGVKCNKEIEHVCPTVFLSDCVSPDFLP